MFTRLTLAAGNIIVALLAVWLSIREADDGKVVEAPPPMKLLIKTDRSAYDSDDTIMIDAEFNGDGRKKLQFTDAASGTAYFHFVIGPIGKNQTFNTTPLHELQFLQIKFRERAAIWQLGVRTGLTRQLRTGAATSVRSALGGGRPNLADSFWLNNQDWEARDGFYVFRSVCTGN